MLRIDLFTALYDPWSGRSDSRKVGKVGWPEILMVDRLSDDRLTDDRLSDDRLTDDRLSDDRLSDDRYSGFLRPIDRSIDRPIDRSIDRSRLWISCL